VQGEPLAFEESPHKGKAGLRRIANAAGYSLAGLAAAVRHESAFRQLVVLLLIAIPPALWLGRTGVERAVMIGVVAIALVAELLNAAVEGAVDRVSLEDHRFAKRAKDIGSAAVMLALVNAAAVWLLIILS
jgi:diacylglycerol kinase (ATP)